MCRSDFQWDLNHRPIYLADSCTHISFFNTPFCKFIHFSILYLANRFHTSRVYCTCFQSEALSHSVCPEDFHHLQLSLVWKDETFHFDASFLDCKCALLRYNRTFDQYYIIIFDQTCILLNNIISCLPIL